MTGFEIFILIIVGICTLGGVAERWIDSRRETNETEVPGTIDE